MDGDQAQQTTNRSGVISVIIPLYNEAANVPKIFEALQSVAAQLEHRFEYIFVNDGSRDTSAIEVRKLRANHSQVTLLNLARNFGKEIALTAGLHHAQGDAAIMLDADLQHPPRYIPEFIHKWQQGADIVVGVRTEHGKESLIKHWGSKLFYQVINKISHVKITPHATDFRLLDRSVVDQFTHFTERNRIVRGLIDWLGFEPDIVYFEAAERQHGEASYSISKLFRLAMDTFVSMSLVPLRISGYLGLIIIVLSGPLGFIMFLDTYFLGNKFQFTGSASVGVLVLFLVGITLINLGLMGLYIANIHNEVINRPLYVLRRDRSARAQSTAPAVQS